MLKRKVYGSDADPSSSVVRRRWAGRPAASPCITDSQVTVMETATVGWSLSSSSGEVRPVRRRAASTTQPGADSRHEGLQNVSARLYAGPKLGSPRPQPP